MLCRHFLFIFRLQYQRYIHNQQNIHVCIINVHIRIVLTQISPSYTQNRIVVQGRKEAFIRHARFHHPRQQIFGLLVMQSKFNVIPISSNVDCAFKWGQVMGWWRQKIPTFIICSGEENKTIVMRRDTITRSPKGNDRSPESQFYVFLL